MRKRTFRFSYSRLVFGVFVMIVLSIYPGRDSLVIKIVAVASLIFLLSLVFILLANKGRRP